jgi:hypothetical protein
MGIKLKSFTPVKSLELPMGCIKYIKAILLLDHVAQLFMMEYF